MKLSDAIPIVEAGVKNGINIILKGSPGLGKSDSIKQVAANLGYELMISHPTISEPTDYKGLPALVNGAAEFLAYGDLRRMIEADKPLIVNFDDVGTACNAVQAALMQISLEKQIGNHKVSPFVKFIMCTNSRRDCK